MSDAITWTNTTVRLGDLKPWSENPRHSTKKQAEKLLQSWQKFGQVETIACSPDMDVYNGHQRLSALLTVYGRDYVIEARQASRHLTEAEKRELTITLHAGATGSWDWDSLSSWQPAELTEWGFDTELLTDWRLNVASLGNFLESEEEGEGGDAEPQIDRAAELKELWGVESGQLWRMESRTPGNFHLLICGDCTDAVVVDSLMGGQMASMVFTDPPFAIYGASTGVHSDIADDNMIRPFFRDFFKANIPAVKQWGHLYVCCDWRTYALIWSIAHDQKLKAKTAIVWDKGEGGLGAYYQSQHELIILLSREPSQAVGHPEGLAQGQSTVLVTYGVLGG